MIGLVDIGKKMGNGKIISNDKDALMYVKEKGITWKRRYLKIKSVLFIHSDY